MTFQTKREWIYEARRLLRFAQATEDPDEQTRLVECAQRVMDRLNDAPACHTEELESETA